MGALTERIRADLTKSMKARDAARTSTLRLLQSSLKNEQIELGHEPTDEEAQAVIRRAIKQRHDSIEQYEKGGRADLADKEKHELAILETYRPQQMSDLDVEKLVQDVVEMVGAESKKDVGRVMKEIMAKYKGQIDGKKAQEILSRLLP
ncbi:MAG TPA: GatB/YqeY domain-containing protein [Thermoanaerobaculia bacterium]